VCDRFERYEALKEEMKGACSLAQTLLAFISLIAAFALNGTSGVPNIQVLKDGHQVSRISDFIIYSVEAEFISQVVKTYGPCQSFWQLG
jgi:prephenate dehydrogenase (NADP+)